MAVPERAVTNDELASTAGVDPEWVIRRTGIAERHVAGPDDHTSTLAAEAGRRALADAGVDPGALDLIVVATCTPDRLIPATAPVVQALLGATKAGAFDINAACAGFLTALSVCSGLIRSGAIERALVVGAEILSRFIDWDDPKTCVLFGDGAGAVVLEASAEPAGLLATSFGADGSGASLIHIAAGGSSAPSSHETVDAREHMIRMNGPEVYRAAVRVMTGAADDALSAAGMKRDDVDLLICHQANQRIIAEVGRRLGLPDERVFSNVWSYGNTSAASIPIAICEAAANGDLQPGSVLLLSAVGAGLTWASGVVSWTAARQKLNQTENRTSRMELAHGH
jgi:3-oxoacyl-[acyl-carrier-protein] synthase-3